MTNQHDTAPPRQLECTPPLEGARALVPLRRRLPRRRHRDRHDHGLERRRQRRLGHRRARHRSRGLPGRSPDRAGADPQARRVDRCRSRDARRARTAVAQRARARADAGPLSAVTLSPDHRAALATFTIKGDADTAERSRRSRCSPQSPTRGRASPDLRIEEVGGAAIDKALDDKLGDDFQKAELLSLPLTLLILIAVFGALVAAGIPLILALTSIIASFGLAASRATSSRRPRTSRASC